MLFFSPFYSSKNPKKDLSFHKKILSNTTVFKIDKKKKKILSSKSAYRMISEKSCDTEDWSNDAENSAYMLMTC